MPNRPSPATDSGEVLVRVEGVSKKFCRSLKRSLWYGVCDIASELNPFRRQSAKLGGVNPREVVTSNSPPDTLARLRPDEFWALNNVSFKLHRGECLGLIGHNGAGKTTLLKMLNGLIKPDTGRIEMNGRVGALIALGAGFNPILTGRENIYINGSVLGLSKKELDEKIDEIIEFSEISEFIDMPVQNYSSGMQVRLGFAAATALRPDILILDEILAVGDAPFRAKCYQRIGQLQKNAAVIFVSHAMDQIAQVCSKVLCLKHGEATHFSEPTESIQWYNSFSRSLGASDRSMRHQSDLICSFRCSLVPETIAYGESLSLTISINSKVEISNVLVRILIYDSNNKPVCEIHSHDSKTNIKIARGQSLSEFSLGPIHLKSGNYYLGVWLQREGSIEPLVWSMQECKLSVEGPIVSKCSYALMLRPVQHH